MARSSKVVVMLMLLTIGACASDDEKVFIAEEPVDLLYNKALTSDQAGQHKEAVELFAEVERQHPYSSWARRSILMAAHAAFKAQNYARTIADTERYLELYPGANDAPYALYLMGMSYYEQIEDVDRDQGSTAEALKIFNTIMARYPNSDYALDAKLKRDLVLDHLAGREMEVGRYYLERNYYGAAIGRFNEVIRRYETASHTPEALYRLVECYAAIGLVDEARRVAAILAYNAADTVWYEKAFNLLDGNIKPPKGFVGSIAEYLGL